MAEAYPAPLVVQPTGTGPMPYYRLYHLDQHSGHINAAEELYAPDDVSALHSIQQRRSAYPLEVWLDGRKVARIDAMPMMAAIVPPPKRALRF